MLNSADGTISILDIERRTQTAVVPLGVPDAVDVAKGYVSTGPRNVLIWLGYNFVLPLGPVPHLAGLAGGVLRGFDTELLVAAMPAANAILLLYRADNPLGISRTFRMASAASGPAIAPGGLASMFFGPPGFQEIAREQASMLPLPTTLGGASLLIGGTARVVGDQITLEGGTPAPFLFASPTQINLQIPPQFTPEPILFQLVVKGKVVFTELATLAPTAPAIFQFASGPAVLNQDNTINGPLGPSSLVHPAARGSVIQIFATGAGATDPPLRAGEAAPASGNPLVLTRVQPEVKIGGVPAPVLFSGLAPGLVGVWQINAQVPMGVAPGPTVRIDLITPDTFSVATIVVE